MTPRSFLFLSCTVTEDRMGRRGRKPEKKEKGRGGKKERRKQKRILSF